MWWRIFLAVSLILTLSQSNGQQTCMTIQTSGGNDFPKPCVFPFKFDGKTYFQCTSFQDTKPWCSTQTDQSGNHVANTGEWGHCDLESCSNDYQDDDEADEDVFFGTGNGGRNGQSCSTTSGTRCVFPFRNNGKVFTSCTLEDADDGRHWCSVQTDSDDNHIKGEWSHCSCDQRTCCSSNRNPGDNPFDIPSSGGGGFNGDLPRGDQCAQPNRVGNFENIINGDNATLNQFPYAALIGSRAKRFPTSRVSYGCGGSLITLKHVLSAAHCFLDREDSDYVEVLLGEVNVDTNPDCDASGCTDPVQKVPIRDIISYPDFQPRGNFIHDIALVKLARSARLAANVRPICLPSFADYPVSDGKEVRILGWGRVQYDSSGEFGTKGVVHPVLQHTTINTVSHSTCRRILTRLFSGGGGNVIETNHICASEEGRDSCRGDSGGPLVEETTKTITQIGIVSYGSAKCGDGNPSVYTRVSFYLDWIKRNL